MRKSRKYIYVECFYENVVLHAVLEPATPFSIVLLLGRFSYHLPISDPSISVVFVLAISSIILLHSSCSDYSLQVIVSANLISYSLLLLSATLVITRNK